MTTEPDKPAEPKRRFPFVRVGLAVVLSLFLALIAVPFFRPIEVNAGATRYRLDADVLPPGHWWPQGVKRVEANVSYYWYVLRIGSLRWSFTAGPVPDQ